MHEKGIPVINKALAKGKLLGLDDKCGYRPCHEGLEDCTFCFCPFYPCNESSTGGYEVISKKTGQPVWACSKCTFAHTTKNAQKILAGLKAMGLKIEEIPLERLLTLRSKILNETRE